MTDDYGHDEQQEEERTPLPHAPQVCQGGTNSIFQQFTDDMMKR
jgi:hypothetical protein